MLELLVGLVRRRILRHMTDGQFSNFRIYCMQILKMHNLTQNYRINLAARGILQSHGTLRHMTDESNNGISMDPISISIYMDKKKEFTDKSNNRNKFLTASRSKSQAITL